MFLSVPAHLIIQVKAHGAPQVGTSRYQRGQITLADAETRHGAASLEDDDARHHTRRKHAEKRYTYSASAGSEGQMPHDIDADDYLLRHNTHEILIPASRRFSLAAFWARRIATRRRGIA